MSADVPAGYLLDGCWLAVAREGQGHIALPSLQYASTFISTRNNTPRGDEANTSSLRRRRRTACLPVFLVPACLPASCLPAYLPRAYLPACLIPACLPASCLPACLPASCLTSIHLLSGLQQHHLQWPTTPRNPQAGVQEKPGVLKRYTPKVPI